MATIIPRLHGLCSNVSTISRSRVRKPPTEHFICQKNRSIQKYHQAVRLLSSLDSSSEKKRQTHAFSTVLKNDPLHEKEGRPENSSVRTFSSLDLSLYTSFTEAERSPEISEEQVRDLFQVWNSALATGPDAVARCYSRNAVLLPTVSDVPRTTRALIQDYFVGFLKKQPRGEVLDSSVMIGQGWCADFGIYEFTMGATGDKVRGRYSFVYVDEDGAWKIAHHHSSVMPEALLGPAPKPKV
eukprot:CAMPEP_0194303038 /NCGR_PEP_ID=MMETSP0171-20130528/944_1 /TAXON_ID=218684 /ORGANISM="Corethron pennatum, Strain L29A3" /LENGTH=240 /DNA_ID=CAMNT_0039053759 /DNA_START=164 /DNA_END=886 /DNA_ORIENTATION=+